VHVETGRNPSIAEDAFLSRSNDLTITLYQGPIQIPVPHMTIAATPAALMSTPAAMRGPFATSREILIAYSRGRIGSRRAMELLDIDTYADLIAEMREGGHAVPAEMLEIARVFGD
jgi:hypothetical protein